MTSDLFDRAAADADLPFRQVAQALPAPCWISDADGSIIWVNSAWVAYTGMDVDAIRTAGLAGLHDSRMLPKVQERWQQVKTVGQPAEMTFPLKGLDGLFRPFLTRVVPLRDSKGALTRWFGTNTDVSEQSKIEAALRDSQRRLELATEAAQLGIWDWNLLDNSFIYSPRARAICGYPTHGDVTYEDVVRATHPDDFPRTSAMADRALDPAVKSVEKYRYRVVRPDGEVRLVEAQGQAVFEVTTEGVQRAVRYVGTLLDITDVARREESVRETEAVLNSLFDASELYIAVVEITEGSFRYVLANRATLAFYNQPPDAAGFDARDIGIPPDELKQWRATFLEVWESGKPRTMEYGFDGGRGPGWYLGTYTPLPAGREGRPRVSFVVIDVSERKRADERQSLLMREVDHRAKNALAVAQAIVQLTQADTVDAFRRAVHGRVAALARVHTLLAEERWAGADLGRLVREELEPYVIDRPKRALVEGPTYALPPAIAQTIGLVLHELTTNAAKHGALSEGDGDVQVTWSVEPNGDLKIVWRERSKSPASDLNHRGFGFIMLQTLIEKQLGGRWSIERPAGGFTCILSLPSLNLPQEASPGVPRPSSQRQALIVEDEHLISLSLEDELKALGIATIATAGRLLEAEQLLKAESFDFAVLDLNLAGESTVDLARSLRDAGTKVIFCTGYQSANLPPDLASTPVLTKPVLAGDLRNVLRQLGFSGRD